MKCMTILTSILLVSQIASAQSSDRVYAGETVGISHSENFEYACRVFMDGKPNTIWLDTNFSEETPYRLAIGLFGETLAGMIAFEMPIESYARGRCPGLCLSLDAPQGSSEFKFEENRAGKISVTSISRDGSAEVQGECALNEVH